MEKFLENVGLFRWYAWIGFLKFKKDFSGGWDIEFREWKTPKGGRLPIAIKNHRLVVLRRNEDSEIVFVERGRKHDKAE